MWTLKNILIRAMQKNQESMEDMVACTQDMDFLNKERSYDDFIRTHDIHFVLWTQKFVYIPIVEVDVQYVCIVSAPRNPTIKELYNV